MIGISELIDWALTRQVVKKHGARSADALRWSLKPLLLRCARKPGALARPKLHDQAAAALKYRRWCSVPAVLT